MRLHHFIHALTQCAISLDQAANNLLSLFLPGAWSGSWADETLSSRAYRAWRDGKMLGRVFMPVIDFLFRWQTLPEGAIGHCHGAYLKERTRYNMPPEMRQ